MIISRLMLKSFGKFQNREIILKEGINVVYGENESGKSTLHTFLYAMFFGLRRRRGRASRTDAYTRYKPWKESSRYEGTIWFTCGEKQFRLERDFASPQSSARLFCETDGELLSVADGDLDMLLGNVSETVFQNTVFVPQARSRTEEGLYTELRDYLADFQGTGDMRFDLERAEEILKARKKHWEEKEKEEQYRKERAETKIRYEIQHEQAEMEILEKKRKALEESSLERQSVERETEVRNGRSFHMLWRIWMALLAVTAILGIGTVLAFGATVCGLMLFLAAGAGLWFYEKRRTVSENDTRIRERQKVLRETQQERKTRLENLEEEYRELRQDNEEMLRIRREIRSVTLAIQKLQEAAKRMRGFTGGILTQKMSEAVRDITGGRYRQVVLDENFQIYLDTGESCLGLHQVSYGTAEQVYLALRMACREILCREEELPLVLDETFAMYDHKRLSETLKYIHRRNSQVILFSCNKREIEALLEAGIPFHRITL